MVTLPPAGNLTLLKILAPTPVGAGGGSAGQSSSPLPQQGGNTAPPQAPQFPAGSTQTGTVIAQGQNNILTLRFAEGLTMQVQAKTPMPVGTKVTIQVLPNGTAQVLNMVVPTPTLNQQAFTQFTAGWQQLASALTTLQKELPGTANRLQSHIPNAQNFLPAIMAFTNAVGSNNLAAFLGAEMATRLGQMGVDLSADFTALSRLAEPNADGWRTLIFPYMEQEDHPPQQGQFFWHTQTEDDESHTRFLLNLEFSNIGQIQLDGLMHAGQLFLKLRMHASPGQNFERELKEIVENALKAANLNGHIELIVTDKFTPAPVQNLLQSSHHLNVTI